MGGGRWWGMNKGSNVGAEIAISSSCLLFLFFPCCFQRYTLSRGIRIKILKYSRS